MSRSINFPDFIPPLNDYVNFDDEDPYQEMDEKDEDEEQALNRARLIAWLESLSDQLESRYDALLSLGREDDELSERLEEISFAIDFLERGFQIEEAISELMPCDQADAYRLIGVTHQGATVEDVFCDERLTDSDRYLFVTVNNDEILQALKWYHRNKLWVPFGFSAYEEAAHIEDVEEVIRFLINGVEEREAPDYFAYFLPRLISGYRNRTHASSEFAIPAQPVRVHGRKLCLDQTELKPTTVADLGISQRKPAEPVPEVDDLGTCKRRICRKPC